MSFAYNTKTEVCAIPTEDKHCKKALVAGMLAIAGSKSGDVVKFSTENIRVKDLLVGLVGDLYKAKVEVVASERMRATLFGIEISNSKEMLEDIGMDTIAVHFNYDILKRDCCKRAFIRGAFLGGGSVTDPTKSYHMEISTKHLTIRDEFLRLLMRFGIKAKNMERNGYHVFYIKGSEKIQDMLALIGANRTTLKFVEVKINNEVRNNVNRRQNCELANMDKTAAAASEHKKALDKINTTIGIDFLPPDLEPIAWTRLENMEATMSELGGMLDPPITKSAVSRKLKKIIEIAKTLEQNEDNREY
ncbi:MAG: DNA-binding protein WhiA [Eubacteriales bacterium]|nr:DNA-binding protein WhiA [Eubacteriales bacterium]